MPRSPRLSVPAALAAALVLAVTAGCGGDGGDESAAAETPAAETPAAETTTTTTAAGAVTTIPPITAPAPDSAAADDPAADPTADAGTGDCAETAAWGSGARGAEPMAVEDVYLVRPGRHGCYDRVVFDVNGVVEGPGSVGFHVAYADGDVRADGSGEPVPTAGDAALEVVVRAPALGYGTSGHQPSRVPAGVGDDLVTTDQVAGWPALRQVAFAGSFEGQTTFAVGVGERVPFRAGAFESEGATHVYVDIAHP